MKSTFNHRFLVAQLGARMHYAIPRMLQEAGLLDHFYTDICGVKGWPRLLRLVPGEWRPSGLHRLLDRVPHGVPAEKISAFTSLGWAYWQSRLRAVDGDRAMAVHNAFGKKFCEAIISQGFGKATASYSFNSAGLELMQAARLAGMKTVMEQTSAPLAIEREIIAEAADRYPSWFPGASSGPNIRSFIVREEEEWQEADCILCGSEFVRNGIARRGGPVDKCRIVPYGVDQFFKVDREPRKSGPLRVLTVSEVGLRKGSPVVWETAELVGGQATFRMVGRVAVPSEILQRKPVNVDLVGPVPRSEIVEHYRWADVFLLPSLSEGSATVTYEAMTAGLPVICTLNTGSVVEHNVNGQIVPLLSAGAVAEVLQKYIENPIFLAQCSAEASKRRSHVSLAGYQTRLLAAVNTL